MRTMILRLAGAALVLSAATPAFAADDMDSNPITEFFASFGSGDKEKPDIDYRERAPLVPPTNTAALPPPAAVTHSDSWPNDPDAQARAERKARNDELPTETYNYRMDKNSRLSPSELQGKRTVGGGTVGGYGGTSADNDITRLSPSELKAKRKAHSADATPVADASPASNGPRTRLSDPPPGYLQGNGVVAEVKPEEKSWLSGIFGK